jgi:catechol 2,3-dioxygenase-like lactoylglutathione lyase family enzyme
VFTEAFPILSTRDLPRLLGFYQGLLGFTETYRFPAEGERAARVEDPDGNRLVILSRLAP